MTARSGRPRRRTVLALTACAAVSFAGCGGDAQPETSADSAPATTGVTVPDEVGTDSTSNTTTPVGDAGPTTTSAAAENLILTSEAPPDFPSDFPQPDDAEFVVGSATTVGDDRVLSIDLVTSASPGKVAAFFLEAVQDAEGDGFTLLMEEVDAKGEPPSAEIRFQTDDYLGDVLVTRTDAGTAVVLTATLPPD